jgi:HSP20 family protein
MYLVRRGRSEWPEMFQRYLDPDWEKGWMRVEEYRDGDDVVVRAELPGIDPDQDVEVSVTDGILHIEAHREEQSEQKEKDGYRSEFRYGSFSRSFVLPANTDEGNVTASYNDGVLEVRLPAGPEPKQSVTRIPVSRS